MRRRVDPNDGVGVIRSHGQRRSVGRQRTDRNLQRNRVDVDAGQGIDTGSVGARDQVVARDRPQVTEVEDGAEVDEEAVGPLAGEDVEAIGHPVHRRGRQRRVVRRAANSHIAGRAGEHSTASRGWADGRRRGVPRRRVDVDPRDLVGLPAVPGGAVARRRRMRDGPCGIEERVRIEDLCRELELVGDGRGAGPRVVDVDLVEHIVPDGRRIADDRLGAELEEVRPTVRGLQRHIVGDDRDRFRAIGADERVHVRAVSGRVLGNGRCFSVGRHVQFTS